MSEISEGTLEQVWQEVSQLPAEQVPKEMQRVGRSQPDLMALVLAATEDRRVEVREIGIYLFYVMVRVFERATSRNIPRIPDAELHRYFKQNIGRVKQCGSEQRWFEEQASPAEMGRQPAVVQSLIRALRAESKGQEGTGELGLRGEEVGALFFALRTVLDALLDARAAVEAAPTGQGSSGEA